MKSNAERIIKKVEDLRNEIFSFLRDLIKAKSVNPFNPNEIIDEPIEKEVAYLIYDKLREFGFSPKFVAALPNRPNVLCSIGGEGKTLILNGHMDTVPVNPKEWKYDPFSAKIVENKLYGRGALDMKSGLVAMIYTLKILADFDLNGKLIFTAVVDEEPGACSKIGTCYLLDNGLQGDACIIGEPGTKKISIGCKGGYRAKIIVKGEAVHTGSRDWEEKIKGENAITKMASLVLKLEKLKLKYKPIKLFRGRKPVITTTLIRGGTAVNVVPSYCEAIIDVRLLPGQTKKYIKEKIMSIGDVKIEDLMFVPSVYISDKERIVEVLKRNATFILGREPIVGPAGPWCDAHFFITRGIPTICGFGPDGGNQHAPNEFVYLDSVIDVCKIYALSAYDFFD